MNTLESGPENRPMTSQWTVTVACALALGWPSPSAGQSLADVARQEAARRQTVARGKVITNEDLKPAPPVTAAPASAPGTTLPAPPALDKAMPPGGEQKSGPAEPGPSAAEKKDEKYWRGRVTTVRDNLARAQTFEVALQARIAALSLDFVNRDDPAQRSRVEADRLRAIAELDRVKKEILQHETDLTTIATEARQAGAPAGWVR